MSAITRLTEDLYINFNSTSKITQGIFLDFSKAFDTVQQKIQSGFKNEG